MEIVETMALHEILEEQLAAQPDAVAVRDRDSELTYRQLDEQSRRLAGLLLAAGVGPEAPVGVCLARSTSLLVAFFAVLRAGGGYLPLDPANPAQRLAWLVADSGARVVISDAESLAGLPATVTLLGMADAPPAEGLALPGPVSADSLAYLIYTSGSSGQPKGVMVTHRNALHLVRAQRGSDLVPAGAGVLGFASIGFDASVWEMLLAVGHGAPLHVVVDQLEDDLSLARDCVATLVPSVLEQLDPAGVRFSTLVSAGEPLRSTVAKRWAPVCPVRNAYGPTEATVCATLSDPLVDFTSEPSIGQALPGSTAAVLTPDAQPVGIGEVGELVIGGAGVSRGYLGSPGLTAARFVPDPAGAPGSRRYRSGDLVRQRPEGELEFVGRVDDQVKINGRRVELAEVEQALLGVEGVTAARVVYENGPEGARQLIAALTPADPAFEPEVLRGELAAWLPEYMIPTVLARVDAFPLTVNGKLDVAALREQLSRPQPSSAGLGHPAKDLIAAIWAGVLSVDQVQATDHFFTLGGHSLLATRLIARLRSVLRRSLSMRTLFQAPVLGDFLAEVLTADPAKQPDAEQRAEYWRELQRDAPSMFGVPAVTPGPVTGRRVSQDWEFPTGWELAVTELARAEMVTPLTVHTAAFARALCQSAQVADVLLATRDSSSEPIALRVRPAADEAWADSLAAVRNGILDAFAHREQPPAVAPSFTISLRAAGQSPLPADSPVHLAVVGEAGELRCQLSASQEAGLTEGELDSLREGFHEALGQLLSSLAVPAGARS